MEYMELIAWQVILLEGLVFGRRIALEVNHLMLNRTNKKQPSLEHFEVPMTGTETITNVDELKLKLVN